VELNDANSVKVKSQLREENTRKILKKKVITKTQTISNVKSASPKPLLRRRKMFKSPSSLAQRRRFFKVD
jgi:hypothetical protein